MEKAIFAAGCFWGVEESFRVLDGVLGTRVGYTGGEMKNPSYQDVCTGETGHAEAVEIIFDSKTISYKNLLKVFWNIHDATQKNRQGLDIGTQYRSAIFFNTPEQEIFALESKKELENSSEYAKPIVTEILPAGIFYPAEEYHQKYIMKRGGFNCHIR